LAPFVLAIKSLRRARAWTETATIEKTAKQLLLRNLPLAPHHGRTHGTQHKTHFDQQKQASTMATTMRTEQQQQQLTQQIIQQYRELVQESQRLAQKISELETDRNEHKLVEETLGPLDPSRKAYRLVGEVLVERTVQEVLPSVIANRVNVRTLNNLSFWYSGCMH
jgi:prefoldin subunit 2